MIVKSMSCTLYFFMSLSTTIMNKYIMTILSFNLPYLLVVLQSVMICSIMLFFSMCGMFKLNLSNMVSWLIPSMFLTIMILSGSKSFQYLPMSMYTLFKNGSIIMVSMMEYIVFESYMNTVELLSYMFMIFSSYVGDLSDDMNLFGYLWVTLNMISTTMYLISLSYNLKLKECSKVESMFFPNLVAMFMVGVLSIIFEYSDYKIPNVFTFCIILMSSMSALLTSLSTSYLLKLTSSTTYSMMGGLNKMMMGFMGFVFMKEEMSSLKMYSLTLGSISILLYMGNINMSALNLFFLKHKEISSSS